MTVSQFRLFLEDIPGGHEVRVEFPGFGAVAIENAKRAGKDVAYVILLAAVAPRPRLEPPKPAAARLAEALSDLIEEKMPSAYSIADALADELVERTIARTGSPP